MNTVAIENFEAANMSDLSEVQGGGAVLGALLGSVGATFGIGFGPVGGVVGGLTGTALGLSIKTPYSWL